MTRYFFHSADGDREYDLEGTELPDEQAARQQAISYAGEVLRFGGGELWHRGQWRVEVTDRERRLLFTIIAVTVDAPPYEEIAAA